LASNAEAKVQVGDVDDICERVRLLFARGVDPPGVRWISLEPFLWFYVRLDASIHGDKGFDP
jgi:hypothetical protein